MGIEQERKYGGGKVAGLEDLALATTLLSSTFPFLLDILKEHKKSPAGLDQWPIESIFLDLTMTHQKLQGEHKTKRPASWCLPLYLAIWGEPLFSSQSCGEEQRLAQNQVRRQCLVQYLKVLGDPVTTIVLGTEHPTNIVVDSTILTPG